MIRYLHGFVQKRFLSSFGGSKRLDAGGIILSGFDALRVALLILGRSLGPFFPIIQAFCVWHHVTQCKWCANYDGAMLRASSNQPTNQPSAVRRMYNHRDELAKLFIRWLEPRISRVKRTMTNILLDNKDRHVGQTNLSSRNKAEHTGCRS